jgi:hypothetical protein
VLKSVGLLLVWAKFSEPAVVVDIGELHLILRMGSRPCNVVSLRFGCVFYGRDLDSLLQTSRLAM